MDTQKIWHTYGQELYFFILKNVKNKDIAHDILQNTFLKIHKNIHRLKTEEKLRAWVFQISRNEIVNYFHKERSYHYEDIQFLKDTADTYQDVCCFDRFIDDLPENYREVIELTYVKGKKQDEVAKILEISLANVKARIRRSKVLLKERFQECCKYELNSKGMLIGTPDCTACSC